MRFFVAVLTLLLGLTSAQAEIAGQNDPRFKAALAQWLEGDDDLAALTALSELAKADNRAAQVFLGRLDFMRHTHSHITGSLGRKKRNALLRAQGGLSGTTWLKIASANTPLAAELLKANKVRERLNALGPLLQFNENATAFRVLTETAYDVHGEDIPQMLKTLEDSSLPAHVHFFTAHFKTLYALENETIQMSEAIAFMNSKHSEQDAFMWTKYTWVDLVNGEITASEIDPYLVDNKAFIPLQKLCTESCGSDIPKCMRALNGTPVEGLLWLTISSPTETILSTVDYRQSRRVVPDLKRLLRATIFHPDWLKRYDQCAYQAVFAE
ncbi:MAG TPA: hypothetical protein ENJ91_06790 [Rhodobacteraceae bacterium]|nr:hypothetical protein [Paracoccaceae bacterium]